MQIAIVNENESQQLSQCPICQEYQGDNFELECKHRFCRKCLEQYLNVKIDEGIVMQIRCPSCRYNIQYEEIVQIIQKIKLEKYAKLRLLQYGENDPLLRHCPNKSCELYVNLNSNKCLCGQNICVDCGNQSHGFSSCNKLMDQIFILDSRQEKIQRCPKCKIIVQKEGGCNHMTCKRCQYQFCWICRRQYTTKHYNKYNYIFGCPNKLYSNTMPWKHPKLIKILIFFLLIISSPLWIILSILLLVLHPFCGSYRLFNDQDRLAVGRLSKVQMCLIVFFVYIIGGIVLYPFVVISECIMLLVYLMSLLVRLIMRLRKFF